LAPQKKREIGGGTEGAHKIVKLRTNVECGATVSCPPSFTMLKVIHLSNRPTLYRGHQIPQQITWRHNKSGRRRWNV